MSRNCRFEIHHEKQMDAAYKDHHDVPNTKDDGVSAITTKRPPTRTCRDFAIMFLKGFLLLQCLIVLFYRISPTTAAPPATLSSNPSQGQGQGQGQAPYQLSDLPKDNWQKYVRAPPDQNIKPVKIVSFKGNVQNPDGLLTGEGTTLTRKITAAGNTTAAGRPIVEAPPEIVVDFGQNYPGFLSIKFGGATNSTPGYPGIRLAFSETLQYLSNVSDFSRSDNVITTYTFIFCNLN